MTKLSESCHYFQKGLCHSCDLIDHSTLEYQKLKQSHYNKTLVLGENYFQSRNKAKLVISGTVESPIMGLQAIDLKDCPLHYPLINQLAHFLEPLITKAKLTPYQLKTKSGELKYLIIFSNLKSDQMMLRFVLRSKESLERIQKLVPLIQTSFPQVKLISINLQPHHTSIIEGDEEIILTKEKTLTDKIGKFSFILGPKTFYQVNSEVAQKLFTLASEKTKAIKPKTILDLFCGIGTFAQFCAEGVERVVGVELSEESIDYAKQSAHLNQLPQCQFYAEDVKLFLEREKDFTPDLIIVNPPRRGLGEEIVKLLLNLSPEHLFYSSCNPETLEKDLQMLTTKYEVLEKTPFDMFSLTRHLEIFCVLKRI
ncbi:MAG: 23S rRNA (uracil(1939)-C(5))-methyltransferase RlmD [Bacteriovoracaceae bacterium]